MNLIERTKKLIRERGVKQIFIADQIGVNPPDLSNFMSGRNALKPSSTRKLEELIDTYYTKLPVEI